MIKLIILSISFSFVSLIAVSANNVGQLSKYAGGEFDYNKAVLSGGLVPDGLELLAEGKTGLNSLYVGQNYGEQRAIDDRAEPQQALGYKAYLLNSEFYLVN